MKSIFLVCCLHLLMFFDHSPGSKVDLDQIREQVREIDANKDQYEKSSFTCITINNDSITDNNSLEGAELYEIIETDMVKYFTNHKLAKIEVLFKGTHENVQSEYYFKEDQLVFVRKIKTIFHKSRYHQDFDESDHSIRKDHFYFNDEKLISWFNTKIMVEDKTNPEYSKNELTLLHDAAVYRNFKAANSR